MTDAVTGGLSVSLALAAHQMLAPQPPAPAGAGGATLTPNPNTPAYISPSITFDPETGIVIITFRNADSGKVTQQIPPSEVLTRYRFVEDSGIPNPILPRTTPNAIAGVNTATGGMPPKPPSAAGSPAGTFA